jgi:hypothetical protein
MNRIIITLITVTMLFIAGCATKPAASAAPVASGTPIDIGDGVALPEIAAYDDEAIPALDVAAE